MKFVSTRKSLTANAVESVFMGLAPDGGLFVPAKVEKESLPAFADLGAAEDFVLSRLFGDFPEEVRKEAVSRLLSRFPSPDPVPMVEAGGFKILELFHGRTGAFKDVALSMLPVFMRHAAGGRKVLVLTATSGDTGSAAMQGFAGVDGTEVAVFFPDVGTSRIQRLQMTTPSEPNVHAIAIKGNFDDAQAAVKRIFADKSVNAAAAESGVYLSSANSINTGRLVPQIGYYLLASSRLGGAAMDVVVPSGNFGNILAAYYAKLLGANISKFVCASNVNDVLARFVKTGVYDPGEKFTVTNSPDGHPQVVKRRKASLALERRRGGRRGKGLRRNRAPHGRIRREGPLRAFGRREGEAFRLVRGRRRYAGRDRGRNAEDARRVRLRPRPAYGSRDFRREEPRLS